MPLDRKNYSYLERQRDLVAEQEIGGSVVDALRADAYYAARQHRMDETARAVLANLWCTHRPTHIKTPEQVKYANDTLHQLANESWQIALALEQTRTGYDCRAFQGKRQQEKEIAEAKKVENPS